MKASNFVSTGSILSVIFLSILSVISFQVISYDTGPPAGYSNAPGDLNCTSCHNDYPLQTSGPTWGNITLTSSASNFSSFVHGTTYTFTLSFSDTASTEFGFQLCVLPSGASSSSSSIGTLTATNSDVQIVTGSSRSYVEHTYSGTSAPSSSRSWTFAWTAPSSLSYTGGAVFYVVVNSTNSDGRSTGDSIYAKTFSGTVLPVHLISFNCERSANNVQLNWSTASEVNSDHFNIERSVDAKKWDIINTIKASGNSNSKMNYEYDDLTAVNSDCYYRLKQVDIDGKSQYSDIIIARNDQKNNQVIVYPLPVENKLTISKNLLQSTGWDITVYDLKGTRVISRNEDDLNSVDIDVSSLKNGIYILQIITEGKTEYRKISIEN